MQRSAGSPLSYINTPKQKYTFIPAQHLVLEHTSTKKKPKWPHAVDGRLWRSWQWGSIYHKVEDKHVFPPVRVCVLTLFVSEHAPGIALWLELHQFWTSQHLYNKSPALSYRCYITLQKFTDARLQYVASRGRLIFCTGRWGCSAWVSLQVPHDGKLIQKKTLRRP